MASIDTLRASDGSGNASIATIQSVRSPSTTTIVVDTVQGINATFHATMGTPHTFVDPVTSEAITVISEATAVDFQGHVDGGNLEIDTIAPGFIDNGSAVSDIVIIKPTTQWADKLADVLDVVHNDDGTLANNTVNTNNIGDGAVTPIKRSGGFKMGTIDGSTVGTTGNKSITGVGFKPKMVKFVWRFYSAAEARMANGAMAENGAQYFTSTYAGSSARYTANSEIACFEVVSSTGGVGFSMAYVSMNADGFTVNVTTAASPIAITYEAYG